jgi:hypothetical protein
MPCASTAGSLLTVPTICGAISRNATLTRPSSSMLYLPASRTERSLGPAALRPAPALPWWPLRC